MNISKNQIDDLNLTLTVQVDEQDYAPKVDEKLKQYKKSANIPGFRKGKVPMSLIQKQYGKAIQFDEVNKLVQDAISNYIEEEKLDILGYPIPSEKNDFSLENKDFELEFEVGLAPDFEVNYKTDEPITEYEIKVDKKEVDRLVENYQRRFGEFKEVETAEEDKHNITVDYTIIKEEDSEKVENAYLKFEDLSTKGKKLFKGKKVGDTLEASAKDLFKEDDKLSLFFKDYNTDIEELKARELAIVVKSISYVELHEINQELFDQVYGEGAVKDEKEFREKIKEETAKIYKDRTDQKLFNDSLEALILANPVELPKTFLAKWIKTSEQQALSDSEAENRVEESIKGLRFQLIENKIVKENDIKINYDEIVQKSREMIQGQMAMYGQNIPIDDERLIEYANSVLQNQEEYKRTTDQVLGEKIFTILKEKMSFKKESISMEDFLKLG